MQDKGECFSGSALQDLASHSKEETFEVHDEHFLLMSALQGKECFGDVNCEYRQLLPIWPVQLMSNLTLK